MKRTLVYNHPYDKSFNAAIKSVIINAHQKSGVDLKVFDLNEISFNPVMSKAELREFSKARTKEGINLQNLDPMVLEMAREINESDELILVFPIWWELMPAQMKGFIDKVMTPGLLYTHVSEFKLKLISETWNKVTVISTMNTPGFLYRLVYGNAVHASLKYGTFMKLGVKSYRWFNLSSVKFKSQSKREGDLRRIEKAFSSDSSSQPDTGSKPQLAASGCLFCKSKSPPTTDMSETSISITTDEKQRAGIDYSAIPALLMDAVIKPGDANYLRVKSTFFHGGAPGIVFQVKNTQQVVEALAFARLHPHLPLSIRSGGHGVRGRSTNYGGIVIDLSRMNKIEILEEATRRVRIEPGARWREVASALAPYGWALTSGDDGGVGVGGLATSGGIGLLARAYGLTIDHLLAVEMVLADGSIVRADEQENPDLFWAIRGAGASFGIVTSFEFQADQVGKVGWAHLLFDASDIAGFLQKWGAVVENSPGDLTCFLIINPARQSQPTIAHVMALVNSDDPQTIANRLQPIAEIAPLYYLNTVITPYVNILENTHEGEHNGRDEPVSRSGSVEHITVEFAAAAARLIESGTAYFFQVRSMGGAISDVPVEATAFGSRLANFEVTAAGTNHERLFEAWDNMHQYFSGLYLSFDTDLRTERLQDAFPPKTLERLRKLKSRYDPDNVFRDNFNILPQSQNAASS